MLRWLPTLWLGFVIVRYGRTSYKSVLSPYNPGSDTEWAIAWLCFILIAIISVVSLKRPVVNWLWTSVFSIAAGAILLLSQSVIPAITALAVLSVSAGIGELMLQFLRVSSTQLIERLVVTIPIGIGFLALAQLALASAGLFNSATSLLLMVLLGVPAVFGIRILLKQSVETEGVAHSLLMIPFGYIFLLNLSWAAAPEIQYDSLNVHLAVPRLYLQNGGLMDLPYFWNSYLAHLLSMIYGLCLAIGGMLTAKFLILGLGVVAVGGVFVIGKRVFSSEVGVWAALIFYTTPLVIWSSSTTYLDLPQSLFVAASAAAFLRWYETSQWGWMAASGWIAGVAMGNKVAAIATVLIFPIIAVARSCRQLLRRPRAEGSFFRAVQPFVAYCMLLLVVAAPWYWIVYEYTGNPFFPFLNAVFRSPGFPIENTSLDWKTFGVGTSMGSLLRIPFRLTWDTSRFGTVGGGVGFALLLVFPLGLGYVWKGTLPQRALLAAAAVHMAVWTYTAQYGRYFISIIPFVAPLGCAIFLSARSGPFLRLNRVLLFIGVLAQVPVASVLFWNISERFPLSLALGRETRESFLARGLPQANVAPILNAIREPQDKVLGIGLESARFYFDAPLYTERYFDLEISGLKTPAALRDALIGEGFRYIVAMNTQLKDPPPSFPYLRPEFIGPFGEEIFHDGTVTGFRIRNP